MHDANLLSASRLCMGSRLEIQLYHTDVDAGRSAIDAALAEAARLDTLLTLFHPGSALCRINREAPSGPVRTEPELLSLIERAQALSRLSGGAFDITASRTRDLRQEALGPADSQKIVVDHARSTVEYRASGLRIDFGAIGKGYAIDRSVEILRARGIGSALVSFGSSIYGLGTPPAARGWRIAIRNPGGRERSTESVMLSNCALSTSGAYEQADHILDPRNGTPAHGMLSASVIAPTATSADALSTAVFVLGPTAALELLGRGHTHGSAGIEAMCIDEGAYGQPVVTRTAGWRTYSPSPAAPLFARRQVLTGLLALAGILLLAPRFARAIVYLTPEEALSRLMPEAETFEHEEVTLTPPQLAAVQEQIGGRIRQEPHQFWIGRAGDTVIGHAVMLNVIGKEQPITFMLAVAPDWSVRGIEVLIYRESQGSEVRSPRFMSQFIGKTLAAPLKLGRDVYAISGATLSSRSTAYAAKKALALVQTVYRGAP